MQDLLALSMLVYLYLSSSFQNELSCALRFVFLSSFYILRTPAFCCAYIADHILFGGFISSTITVCFVNIGIKILQYLGFCFLYI